MTEMSQMSEVSSMSEMSVAGEQQPKGDDEDNKKKMMAVAVCFLLLVGGLLLLAALRSRGSSDVEDADGEENDYAPVPSGGPSSGPPPSRGPPSGDLHAVTTSRITTTTEDTLYLPVNYNDQRYDTGHYYACFFNASRQGMRMFQRTYGIAMFPYMLCHIAIYCCYGLDAQMQLIPLNPTVDLPPRDAARRLAGFKGKNPFLVVYLLLHLPKEIASRLAGDDLVAQPIFLKNVLRWTGQNDYNGIRLWWRYPEKGQAADVTTLAEFMAKGLQQRNMSFGYFVPYESNLRVGFDIDALVKVLLARDTIMGYFADLKRPHGLSAWYFRDTAVLKQEFRLHKRPAIGLPFKLAQKACFWYPGASLSFKVQCPGDAGEPPLIVGPGPAGPYSGQPGVASVSEVCSQVDDSWTASDPEISFLEACKGDVSYAYPTDESVKWMVDALHANLKLSCIGNMNPELDDIAEKCNFTKVKGIYPLLRAGFRLYTDVKHVG